MNRNERELYPVPSVIAEIGCNHMGDIQIAKELIQLAARCGAKAAKFQKRHNRELLTEEQYNAPHPNPMHSYGESYGEHREMLEFSKDQQAELKKCCEENGIIYSTSVWDTTSAREMIELDPEFIKIPSACNTNHALLKVLRDEYGGEIHVSLGMTTRKEEEDLITLLEEGGNGRRIILYACTSGYPVPFENVALLEIKRLSETYGNRVGSIGFSGHHLGIATDIAAYTLGAVWIERHFTKDRTWKGTDHAASLEPQGLEKLIRNLDAVHKSLRYKEEELLEIEKIQRKKLKYRE